MKEAGKGLVLVGISTHNRADLLPKALESALAQSYPSVAVAVVDDASTDATPTIAKRFPNVMWTRWNTNRGYVVARNKLMLESNAEFYVSLDDDAWFLRGDEIEIAIEALRSNPKIAAVAFDILSPDRPEPVERYSPVLAPMFIGCGHILRLDVVHKLGGYASFPDTYGGEEKDLCLRLLDAGYCIVKLPGVHVWHDKSSLARNSFAQHRSDVCNDLSFALWRTPLPMLPLALAWKLLRQLQFAVRARMLRSWLAGVAKFFCAVPRIWAARAPVSLATLRRFSRLSRTGTALRVESP